MFSLYPLSPRSHVSENQPESGLDRRDTENSSFPYSAFPDCVLEGFVARATRLYEQEWKEPDGTPRLGL